MICITQMYLYTATSNLSGAKLGHIGQKLLVPQHFLTACCEQA